MNDKKRISILLTLVVLVSVSVSAELYTVGEAGVTTSNYDRYWNIKNIPTLEISETPVEEYICGETEAGGIGDNCNFSTETQLLFKETVNPGTKYDQRKFTIKNVASPHYVHLDVYLCHRTAITDVSKNKMLCDQIADDLYVVAGEGEQVSEITNSHHSDEIYIYIIAREGGEGDQTKVRVSVDYYAESNNDNQEPRQLIFGNTFTESVCQKGCDSGSDDVHDAYTLNFIKGDSFTVEFWSTECEPSSGNVNYQIYVYVRLILPSNVDNFDSIGWQLNEQDCGPNDGINSYNLTDAEESGQLTVRIYASGNGGSIHEDFNPASYELTLAHHDISSRDYIYDYDGDGISDFDEQRCNSNMWLSGDTPNDLDNDEECDHIDNDDDNDGYDDDIDECPNIYFTENTNEYSDHDGDGCQNIIDLDDDGDGVIDDLDNCPEGNLGVHSRDFDGDGCHDDEDDDDDNDNWADISEVNCQTDPMDANDVPDDFDGDQICDLLDNDDDGDGFTDSSDAFPYDVNEWEDTDNDGIGNNADGDDDGDGFGDTLDVFPLDKTQNSDIDGDGCGDNASGINGDRFPTEPSQCQDTDNDGFGDNQSGVMPDKFPNDSTQWNDADNDGFGDNPNGNNPDAFPFDSTQWSDKDGDGYGDNPDGNNSDEFIDDSTQWKDTDGDEFGDNPNGINGDYCPSVYGTSILDVYGCIDRDLDGYSDDGDDCPDFRGMSSLDRKGCLDADKDGFSDPDIFELAHPNGEADAFPRDSTQWYDMDGDGFGDNITGNNRDDCMTVYGNSTIERNGCPDADGDGYPNSIDSFPSISGQWNDTDDDGFGDNMKNERGDECPNEYGKQNGCPDIDGDGLADKDDPCVNGNNEIQNQKNTCWDAVLSGEVGPIIAQGAAILAWLPILIVGFLYYRIKWSKPNEDIDLTSNQ